MKKKDTIAISIVVSLIFILLFVGINIMHSKIKVAKISPHKIDKSDEQRPSEEKTPTKNLFKMLEAEGRNLELKRDPFTATPIVTTEISSSGGMQLNGILWDKSKSLAVINNTIVKIGDKIGESTVVNIKQDRVILNDGNRNFELKLNR